MRFKCRRYRGFKIIIIFVFAFSVGGGFVMRHLENPFNDAFAAYASQATNDAVNSAIKTCLEEKELTYNDLVVLKENSQGQIVSISADGLKISKLKSEITKSVEEYIANYPQKDVKLNIGASHGNILLASLGPKIKVMLSPSCITKAEFRDEFISAGINQVRHCIYLDITTTVTVTSFSIRKTHEVNNSVLIADTVIVGSVPNLYSGYISQLNKSEE